jgi:hypothetical protein
LDAQTRDADQINKGPVGFSAFEKMPEQKTSQTGMFILTVSVVTAQSTGSAATGARVISHSVTFRGYSRKDVLAGDLDTFLTACRKSDPESDANAVHCACPLLRCFMSRESSCAGLSVLGLDQNVLNVLEQQFALEAPLMKLFANADHVRLSSSENCVLFKYRVHSLCKCVCLCVLG